MRVGIWENGGWWDQSQLALRRRQEPLQLPQCLPRTRINSATNQSEEVNSTHIHKMGRSPAIFVLFTGLVYIKETLLQKTVEFIRFED